MLSAVSAFVGLLIAFVLLGLPAVLLTVYFLNHAKMAYSYASSLWAGAVTQTLVLTVVVGVLSLSNPFDPFVFQAAYAETTLSPGEVGTVFFGVIWFVLSATISVQYRYADFGEFVSELDSDTVLPYVTTSLPLILLFLIDSDLIQVLLLLFSVISLNIHFNSIERMKELIVGDLKPSLPELSDVIGVLDELGDILGHVLGIVRPSD
jgi:hypothetical protein